MKDVFIVITWPHVQELMDIEGFNENSYLINDDPYIKEYGGSAFFVRKIWLDENNITQTLN